GIDFGPVKGNLSAANVFPFDANGSAPGTQQDLNGDGNLDVGGSSNASVTGFFDARAGSVISTPPGNDVSGSLELEVGTLTFTATALNFGGESDINFVPQAPVGGNLSAVWREDNNAFNNSTGMFAGGTPFKITSPAAFPQGPIAVDDTAAAAPGVQQSIDVLQNDFDHFGTIDPASVTILGAPNHGGTAVVDTTTGAITYTPDVNFIGTESFTYTVTDNQGHTSPAGTVTATVSLANLAAPVANDDSANTVLGTPISVDILSNDTASAPATIDASSIILGGTVVGGTPSIQPDGTVLFTPDPNFIGAGFFTYTVNDTNGQTSNIARAGVNVGVDITPVVGGHRVATFSDPDGTNAVVTLNRGTATLQFNGTAQSSVARSGAVTIFNGSADFGLASVTMTGTSAASVLAINARGGADGAISVGSISTVAGASVGVISARTTNLTGNIDVGGVNVLLLNNVADAAQIQIGAAGSPALLLGDVGSASISSGVPLRLLSVRSWTDPVNESLISAPSVVTIVSTHDFASSIDITSGSLGVARIGGALAGGAWTIGGPARAIIALGGVSPAWIGSIDGALGTFSVLGGSGFASSLDAGSISVFNVAGDLSGHLTVGSARVIRATGAISNAIISSAGDITALIAGSMTGTSVTAGGVSNDFTAITTAAELGSNAIRAVVLTSRAANAFSNSTIMAQTITTAVLGSVDTTAVGGLAAAKLGNVTFNVSGSPVHLGPAQLATVGDIKSAGAVDFGNIAIRVLG
ncbi:MAG TPA: Ig-like domain-containing protein, partial [Tepidisphaeraceae bacterium]|nr:Ig-like domain-containing protein [Tepidisphaeraceae bacterium]